MVCLRAVGNASGAPPEFSPLKLYVSLLSFRPLLPHPSHPSLTALLSFSPLPASSVKGNWKVTRPTVGNFLVTDEEFAGYTSELFALMKSGAVKLLVSHTAPFTADGLREAHAQLTGRKTVGKLVLEISKE